MIKYLLTLLLFGNGALSATAQYVPNELPSVPSPNAASLGQFGEVPVSFYSGLAGIAVPIYTLREHGITVPIALNYHASGFRPDQHPGWVGQGWALDAGGSINRVVHDQTDENTSNPSSISTSPGVFFQKQVPANLWTGLSEEQQYNVINNYAANDFEPDEFNFSFGAYSGSFYWDMHTGSWRVKCDKPVTVTLDPTGQLLDVPFTAPDEAGGLQSNSTKYRPSFKGFTIITEDGTQYAFGGTTDAIEYSVGLFRQLFDRWVANTWYLVSITSPNGTAVKLTYSPGSFVCQYFLQQTSSNDNFSFHDGPNANFSCNYPNPTSFGYAGGKTAYSGSLIRPTYLATIKSDNAQVTFSSGQSTELRYENGDSPNASTPPGFYNYRYFNDYPRYGNSANGVPSWRFLPFLQPGSKRLTEQSDMPAVIANLQWRALQAIFIQETGTVTSRSVFLHYNNDNSSLNERLTLTSVQETGVPPYKFDYNIATGGYPALPQYFADKTDHWGFYNNRAWSAPNSGYYASREPAADTITALLGMLKRITYPTGGVTDFRFEPHTYAQQLSEDRSQLTFAPGGNTRAAAGGVRLRATKSYNLSTPGNGVYKEYFYVSNYSNGVINARNSLNSSGVLGGQSKYSYSNRYTGHYLGYTFDIIQEAFSSQSVLSGSLNSKGSHLGYSEVVEKLSNGGYTRYRYSNFSPGNFDESARYNTGTRSELAPYSSTEQQRGNLLAEEAYNANDQLVKAKRIQYQNINPSTEYVDAVNHFGLSPCGMSALIGNISYYKRYTYACLPVSETTTIYDINGNNPLTSYQTMLYNSYKLLASEQSTDSKNQTVLTTYRYPFDIAYPAGTSTTQPPTDRVGSAIYAMSARNMVGFPIETITTRNGFVTNATVQTYAFNELNSSSILPLQFYNLETAQPLSQYTPSTYNSTAGYPFVVAGSDARMRLKATFANYDARGNVVGVVKEGGVLTSYQWDYKKSLAVAKVENAAPNEIFSSSFETDNSVSSVPITPGTWDSSYLRFESSPSDGSPARNVAHTGRLAGAIYTYQPQDQGHAFGTTLTIPARAKRFVFSGWVYSNGPSAQIWLFMNRPAARNVDGTINYYNGNDNGLLPVVIKTPQDAAGRNITGKWIYLEQEVDVPADVTFLGLRLTNHYNGATPNYGNTNSVAQGVWFDDVRIHPADAQMTTYTHNPAIGVTSVSDATNTPTSYGYDVLNRLSEIRDQDGNVLKTFRYGYQQP